MYFFKNAVGSVAISEKRNKFVKQTDVHSKSFETLHLSKADVNFRLFTSNTRLCKKLDKYQFNVNTCISYTKSKAFEAGLKLVHFLFSIKTGKLLFYIKIFLLNYVFRWNLLFLKRNLRLTTLFKLISLIFFKSGKNKIF